MTLLNTGIHQLEEIIKKNEINLSQSHPILATKFNPMTATEAILDRSGNDSEQCKNMMLIIYSSSKHQQRLIMKSFFTSLLHHY